MTLGQWLTAILTISVLTTSVGPATAQPKGGERKPVDKSSPMLMTGKVTQVDEKAKTFTVMSKGKAVTFSAAKPTSLPKIGETVDVRYTQTPGGALEALSWNRSKTNVN
jgi:hypothetical protein